MTLNDSLERPPATRIAVLLTAITCFSSIPALAQSSGFSGFTAGNLVVSRSVYAGDASVFAVGQPLPPVCPTTAKCATAPATDNAAYPSTSSTNNVWNNDKVDGSFGITSPIFLDQISPSGTLVNTLAIPSNMVNTSFSSKSELALNLSTDGSAITFMAYVAPANTVDVSNSNTPGVYDPTNPSGGSYFRAVVQVGPNGAIQVTPTNAYCGNNGRAAILANGIYYMVGNSNNGSGTAANVVAAGGVQTATPGQAANTPPKQAGNFSITSLTDPTTGQPYAADKLGKDDNYRGLTIFNNTLYISKGSGSNGVDTVYQVGSAGALPTGGATITILPGFPTTLARNIGATDNYPFGIWFANAFTVYVADEGDGVIADAAASPSAGLQKWVLTNGTWKRIYVLQNGLNLGQPYSIANYPTSLNPATDGLRNLTGKVNSDGTVTLWALTSTVSSNGDQGADPNKLVTITDVLSNTDPTVAAKEQFTTLRSANAGEVLRGVAFAPTASSTNTVNTPLISSGASPSSTSLAPGGLGFALGQNLVAGTPDEIIGPLPTSYDGASVSIVDAKGNTSVTPLYYVSPWQVTFVVPTTMATGSATVKVVSGTGTQSAGNVQITTVAPALFTLNGVGLAAAGAVRVSASGAQTPEPAYTVDSFGTFAANPINMGAATDSVYLSLFGTGITAAGTSGVTLTINGVNAPVLYSGPQGSLPGIDQVNVQIPASLAGKGSVNVLLTAGGVQANLAQITIQ